MTNRFEARREEWQRDLDAALAGLYGERADELATTLVDRARGAFGKRSDELHDLDDRRTNSPDWYQSHERVGYIAYVDRFGGDLAGVCDRIEYLRELGVDTLHLLSLFEPRLGENDGGYAIRDYLRPDPRLGTPADLDSLIADLRANGISLCVDFVINHTSDDHEWAVAARAGSARHRALYRTFADRSEPEEWERTLPEVFPDLAPGNFTWDAVMERWVWTTFREFQWDLDWSNPDVMIEIVDLALALANLGVEILRLDAVAFTWKRLGTNCQNQPEAHLIAQALRAVLAMAAPATVLLAEAIVGPQDLVAYLGRHACERRECELAYHNQLMVQGWSMLASQRADLARHAISQLPQVPARATWFTYVRCHDDIGWAIDDADARAVGLDGQAHRDFLADFFRGDFWESFGRGTAFATNHDTGDERTSGMAASLAGVSAALAAGDDRALDRAIDRILLLYSIAFGHGGIPMIYMGDELGQLDDAGWADDPVLAGDSRWSHRPHFDESLAALRHDPSTVAGRLWAGLRRLVEARRACLALHDHGAIVETFDPGSPAVFAWRRHHPRFGDLMGLANVGTEAVAIANPPRIAHGAVDLLAAESADRSAGAHGLWTVAPLQVRWITADASYRTLPAPPSR